jgi:hypothetical protein
MHRAVWLIICAGVLLASAAAIAQVQPGSIGGTIGKQDKSASGGNTPEGYRPSTREQKPRHDKSASCGRIAGTWKWGGYTVVIRQDGSAQHSLASMNGTWTCKGRQYVFIWANKFINHVTLSTDGNSVEGVNDALGGTFSGTRF